MTRRMNVLIYREPSFILIVSVSISVILKVALSRVTSAVPPCNMKVNSHFTESKTDFTLQS